MPSASSGTINIQHYIDNLPFSRFHWLVLILCFLIMAADGFDTAAIGFVAPALMKEWGVAKVALGPVLSASLVGLAIGALVSGCIHLAAPSAPSSADG